VLPVLLQALSSCTRGGGAKAALEAASSLCGRSSNRDGAGARGVRASGARCVGGGLEDVGGAGSRSANQWASLGHVAAVSCGTTGSASGVELLDAGARCCGRSESSVCQYSHGGDCLTGAAISTVGCSTSSDCAQDVRRRARVTPALVLLDAGSAAALAAVVAVCC
jgi:hypothetical protein